MDGQLISLAGTRGYRLLYWLRSPGSGYHLTLPSGYGPHCKAGGDPAIHGRYAIVYDALLHPGWRWARSSPPVAAMPRAALEEGE